MSANYSKSDFSRVEDVRELYAHHFDGDVRQLTPGDLGGREVAGFPGVALGWWWHNASIRTQEAPVSGTAVGAIVRAPRPVRWQGTELALGDLAVETSKNEYDFILPAGSEGFLIEIDAFISDEFGWDHSASSIVKMRGSDFADLVKTVRRGLELAAVTGPSSPSPKSMLAIRNQVLSSLDHNIPKRINNRSGKTETRLSRSFGLVRKAEAFVDARPIGQSIVVPELASALCVSERTLERAFKSWTDMGPLRFFTVNRLHEFRRRVLVGRGVRGSIKEAALTTGFNHRGHLSRDYRELFGESPSETIQRSLKTD